MDRPYVTLKIATSLDGRIATASGHSQWITGELARAEVHKMRAAMDAVMVGIGTAIADDPMLTARTTPPAAQQPLRVIMDHRVRLAPNSRLAQSADRRAAVLVMSVGEWPEIDRTLPLHETNVTIAQVRPAPEEGEVMAGLRALRRDHGVKTLLLEGGGTLAAAAMREGMIDRIEWFRAPIIIGGDGKPALTSINVQWLQQAPAWRRVAVRELGPDLWESYERA